MQDGKHQSGQNLSHPGDYLSLSAPVSVLTSGLDKKCHQASTAATALCFFVSSPPPTQSLLPCPAGRHVYDNVGLKGERHIYENVGELRDATPDLILAVKPKVPLEEEQVTD